MGRARGHGAAAALAGAGTQTRASASGQHPLLAGTNLADNPNYRPVAKGEPRAKVRGGLMTVWVADSVDPALNKAIPRFNYGGGVLGQVVVASTGTEDETAQERKARLERLELWGEFQQRFVRNARAYNADVLARSLMTAGFIARERQPSGAWADVPWPNPRVREALHEWAYQDVAPLVSNEADTDDGDDAYAEVGFVIARNRKMADDGADQCEGRGRSMRLAHDGIQANAPAWLALPVEERRVVLPGRSAEDESRINTVLEALAWEQLTATSIAMRYYGAEDEEAARKMGPRVRADIHAARVAGAAVLAGYSGYKQPENMSEVAAYLAEFDTRIRRTFATANRLRQAGALWYPQTEEEWGQRTLFERQPLLPRQSARAEKKAADRKDRNKARTATARAEREREYGLCKPKAEARMRALLPAHTRVLGGVFSADDKRGNTEYKFVKAYFKDGTLPPMRLRLSYASWLPERIVREAEKELAKRGGKW